MIYRRSIDLRKRNWWSGRHAPYRNKIHDLTTDEPVAAWKLLDMLLDDLPDGQAFQISVTGLTNYDVGGRWELTRPHHYERVPRAGVASRSSTEQPPTPTHPPDHHDQ